MSTATATAPSCATMYCRNHRDRLAAWACRKCEDSYCPDCVNVRDVRGAEIEVCPSCSEMCQDVRKLNFTLANEGKFFSMLPDAFSYPIAGMGIAYLLIGVVFFGGLQIFAMVSMLGKMCALIGAGYFTAWLFKIVNETAMGQKEISNWPDVSDVYSDIIGPLWSSFLTVLASFGPAIALFLAGIVVHPLFFLPALFFLAAGALFYPMAFLATALQTRLMWSPSIIIGSIGRVLGPYVVVCALSLAIGVALGIGGLIMQIMSPILGGVLMYAASMYFTVVQMRLLGLLYFTNQRALGWF